MPSVRAESRLDLLHRKQHLRWWFTLCRQLRHCQCLVLLTPLAALSLYARQGILEEGIPRHALGHLLLARPLETRQGRFCTKHPTNGRPNTDPAKTVWLTHSSSLPNSLPIRSMVSRYLVKKNRVSCKPTLPKLKERYAKLDRGLHTETYDGAWGQQHNNLRRAKPSFANGSIANTL